MLMVWLSIFQGDYRNTRNERFAKTTLAKEANSSDSGYPESQMGLKRDRSSYDIRRGSLFKPRLMFFERDSNDSHPRKSVHKELWILCR